MCAGAAYSCGVELVADQASKAPLPPQRKTHARVKAEAMRRGLMGYPSGGTVDGQAGDHVLLAPPFICAPGDIERIVALLAPAINAALSSD